MTNPERTAVITLSDTPWVPAALAAVTAALVAPRLPGWVRRLLFGGTVVWVVRGRRAARYVHIRRELARVAPHALLVGDFVAREPGAAMPWVAEMLDVIRVVTPFVALLPDSGDARRDAARERLYTRKLGLRVVGRVAAGGQQVSILLRE